MPLRHALDLDRLRAETPASGIARTSTMPGRPDAAAGSRRDDRLSAREAEIGGYEPPPKPASLDGVYDSVARLIGAERDEIALIENATVAWQMAFYALAATFGPATAS